ncbi:FAD-binding oxidoreductase, partial [Chloroflexota bacterium]
MERKLYGHDIGVIPAMIKMVIGNTIPDAVVQPESEQELIDLMQWAIKNKIPLTPRGKATTGYGGVLPVQQGLVVDFYSMNQVLEIDAEAMTARVQAGIVWEKLDKELKKKGLTLRLYPSSYPSATVGGWLAQGGAGIGSYEYGWFRDNVVSAKVVLPDGITREFSGDDLDYVSDAEGITGLISEVTVSVKPLEEMGVLAIGCPHAEEFQQLIERMVEAQLPVWSMIFINPRMAELKNKAPLMEHWGHPSEKHVLLPASFILTLTFAETERKVIMDKLPEIMEPCQAELLPDYIAEHEWENRFRLMAVKRLGPSLVPTEFVIPLSSLG